MLPGNIYYNSVYKCREVEGTIEGGLRSDRKRYRTKEEGGVFLIGSNVISNVHDYVFPALLGVANVENIKAIGVVETISALSSIIAADEAVKSADVEIVDLRIARGLGGKSFFIVSGEVSSVNQAIESSIERLAEFGDIVDTVVIPSPSKDFLDFL